MHDNYVYQLPIKLINLLITPTFFVRPKIRTIVITVVCLGWAHNGPKLDHIRRDSKPDRELGPIHLLISSTMFISAHIFERERERDGTSVSRRHFSTTVESCSIFNFEYCSSSFLLFHRALLFWNQTATWRGSRPSSEASLSFLSDSNLCSFPKLNSSMLTCSSLSFLFLNPPPPPPPPPSSPLLFFLRRLRGFASPEIHNTQVVVTHHKQPQRASDD